jgi:hypothetical protein
MASVKKGLLTATTEWCKHLRDLKREFWKRERRAAKSVVRKEVSSKENAA